jgi:hypothetical protein
MPRGDDACGVKPRATTNPLAFRRLRNGRVNRQLFATARSFVLVVDQRGNLIRGIGE